MIKNYRIKEYELDNDFLKSLTIPKFQRGLVWKKKKKAEFIKNVLKGYPFGSILVYKSEKDLKYRVIDGLQRMSTLRKYKDNKFDFLSATDFINREICEKIIKRKYDKLMKKEEIGSEEYYEEISALQKTIFSELKKEKNSDEIYRVITKENGKFEVIRDRETEKSLRQIIKEFIKNTSINGLTIPTIIYSGKYNELPDIFYNLNVGGVKLSKYETFSTLWDDKKIIVNDQEIKNTVKNKYEQIEKDSDFDIEEIDDNMDDGITLFEYCYAISEIVKNKYPLLFSDSKKNTDPTGFELLTLMCGGTLGNESELNSKLKNATGDFLISMKKIIIETLDTMEDALREWIKAKNNSYNVSSSTYMIYHMAMSYIINNYNIDVKNYEVTKNKNSSIDFNMKYKKYLPYYYICDTLSNFWSENRQVSDFKKLLEDDNKNRYYYKITEKKWKKVLDDFKEEQLNYLGNQISFETKLFLDYLVKGKIENEKLVENREKAERYFTEIKDSETKKSKRTVDFEHIVTIELFQFKYKNKSIEKNSSKDVKEIIKEEKLPIYSIGNICYLTSHINRSKQGNTIPSFEEKYPGLTIDNSYRNLVNYPNNEELDFTDYSKEEFAKEYKSFIEKRIENLISDFNTYVIKKI